MSRNTLQIDRDIRTIPLQRFQNRLDEMFKEGFNDIFKGDKSDEFMKGLISGYYTSQKLVEQNQKEYILYFLQFLVDKYSKK
ncbi:MAG: hypothetical protein ACLFPL_02130 [Candidatus Nanoarchaeia archaeon]